MEGEGCSGAVRHPCAHPQLVVPSALVDHPGRQGPVSGREAAKERHQGGVPGPFDPEGRPLRIGALLEPVRRGIREPQDDGGWSAVAPCVDRVLVDGRSVEPNLGEVLPEVLGRLSGAPLDAEADGACSLVRALPQLHARGENRCERAVDPFDVLACGGEPRDELGEGGGGHVRRLRIGRVRASPCDLALVVVLEGVVDRLQALPLLLVAGALHLFGEPLDLAREVVRAACGPSLRALRAERLGIGRVGVDEGFELGEGRGVIALVLALQVRFDRLPLEGAHRACGAPCLEERLGVLCVEAFGRLHASFEAAGQQVRIEVVPDLDPERVLGIEQAKALLHDLVRDPGPDLEHAVRLGSGVVRGEPLLDGADLVEGGSDSRESQGVRARAREARGGP